MLNGSNMEELLNECQNTLVKLDDIDFIELANLDRRQLKHLQETIVALYGVLDKFKEKMSKLNHENENIILEESVPLSTPESDSNISTPNGPSDKGMEISKSIVENGENAADEPEKCTMEVTDGKNATEDAVNQTCDPEPLACEEQSSEKISEKSGQESTAEEQLLNTDELSTSDSNIQEETDQLSNKESKIKLVDIKKLLAPNTKPLDMTPPLRSRKSVTFDSSVIVLSSSDEDTPRKDPKSSEPKPLKSALRRTQKRSEISAEKCLKASTLKKKVLLSENSDSDESDLQENRLLKQKNTRKSKFSSLVKSRIDKKIGRKVEASDGDLSNSKVKRRNKKVGSDSESEEENGKESNTKSKNARRELAELEQNKNDPKLKKQVAIVLPKFECHKLQELYCQNKNFFELGRPSINDESTKHGKNKKNKKVDLSHVVGNKQTLNESAPDEKVEEEPVNNEEETLSLNNSSVININSPVNTTLSSDMEQEVEKVLENGDDSSAVLTEENNEKTDEITMKFEAETAVVEKSNSPNSDSDSNENAEIANESKKRKRENNSSDSEEDFSQFTKKKKTKKPNSENKQQLKRTAIIDSDSETDNDIDKDKGKENEAEGSDSEMEKKKESDKKSRRRIKKQEDSSSEDESKSTRKHIRKLIDRDSLSATTKRAEEEERKRKSRIAEKQKKYNKIFDLRADATVEEVVLDFDETTQKPVLSVHKDIVKQLKPHQMYGIKFMWDACFESVERAQKGEGSGCILAHCMGLGKTLQVVALAHTLLTNQELTKIKRILVVSPVNTVLNWKSEFAKWLPKDTDFEVYELVSCKMSNVNRERNYIVCDWFERGGVMVISYDLFRRLSNAQTKSVPKKLRESFHKCLVDPGADLVVCDEGHLLKNEKTNITKAMNQIKTLRRIVLTGTPLQNNLREYWCMVQFIKPNLLGTYKEYMNRFVNPITNGQYNDSTPHDIMIMRRRSHVLHKLLDGVVQRQDYDVLQPYLPPKHEYVLFLTMSDVQKKLYKHYLEHLARNVDFSNRSSFLFPDFQAFQRICTHPRVLQDKSIVDKEKMGLKKEEEDLSDFIDDDSTSNSSSSDEENANSDESARQTSSKNKSRKRTRAYVAQKDVESSESEVEPEKEWWEGYVNNDELDDIKCGSKLFLLFEILKECEEIGDKVLVFSQSLYTLNCIEYFLDRIDRATERQETCSGYTGSWALGLDYFRLDGSSSCDNRANWCDQFNDPENTRARLFLISTRAGGLGINLVAANRVIIFDVSWNPSHDIQSIYRVYRFGQTKPSYIYRFVTYGTMEMKIYERQVTKQAISKRVIDEQQIDRHYSQNDIMELYKTDLDPINRPIPLVPKDVLLGEMLQKYDKTIYKYHEHQSLLENKHEEELNEDERKAAWEEFENEKTIRKTTLPNFGLPMGALVGNQLNFAAPHIQIALANIIRKDNPTWSEVQIKGIIPALLTQLQMQIAENDFSMWTRVQQELALMQALQEQRKRELMLRQLQQQQFMMSPLNQLLGNMNITPEDIRRLQAQMASGGAAGGGGSGVAGRSNDIIELND